MIVCLVCDQASDARPGALEAVARTCSPRVEPHGDGCVVFDASGLTRVLGSPAEMAREVRRLAADQGLTVRVAIAATTVAAWLLAHSQPGLTVIEPEDTAAALAPLPIQSLASLSGTRWPTAYSSQRPPRGRRRPARAGHYRMAPGPGIETSAFINDWIATFERWGVRTLGEAARLRRADVHARMGPAGVGLHQAACGEDPGPFVPAGDPARFVRQVELEWPIESLEPLSFVLARMCDELSALLERADRGAVEVATRLRLVTRATHERVLPLPAPIRDARVLRTLILLDLESHPPDAAIDVIELEVGVVPGRIVQGSLLCRSAPLPEDLVTLTARLGALMGESRVGAPVLCDTHDARVVAMKPFKAQDALPVPCALCPLPCLRRYRHPLAARVTVEGGVPRRIAPVSGAVEGGAVIRWGGPWRTSGAWWTLDGAHWDRDEWDVELAGGGCYRLARDRVTGRWEIEGLVD